MLAQLGDQAAAESFVACLGRPALHEGRAQRAFGIDPRRHLVVGDRRGRLRHHLRIAELRGAPRQRVGERARQALDAIGRRASAGAAGVAAAPVVGLAGGQRVAARRLAVDALDELGAARLDEDEGAVGCDQRDGAADHLGEVELRRREADAVGRRCRQLDPAAREIDARRPLAARFGPARAQQQARRRAQVERAAFGELDARHVGMLAGVHDVVGLHAQPRGGGESLRLADDGDVALDDRERADRRRSDAQGRQPAEPQREPRDVSHRRRLLGAREGSRRCYCRRKPPETPCGGVGVAARTGAARRITGRRCRRRRAPA
jgi:hypothetical protein